MLNGQVAKLLNDDIVKEYDFPPRPETISFGMKSKQVFNLNFSKSICQL